MTVHLPDPANDETLTMTGYEWWSYYYAIRASLLAELEAGVEGLPEECEDDGWLHVEGGCPAVHRAAVLDLIRKAGTAPHVCRCEHMDADRNSEP